MAMSALNPVVPDSSANVIMVNSRKKQESGCIRYRFTWFHYPENWIEVISSRSFKQWVGQEELCPSTGEPHIQGFLRLFEKERKTAIQWGISDPDPKKSTWVNFLSCAATDEDNVLYCTKKASRKEGGKMYCDAEWRKWLPKDIKLITPDLYWEQEILTIISAEPDDRTIHWYWSEAGKIGKTQFCKYLAVKHGAIPLDGKKNDILYCAAEFDSTLYVIPLARKQEDYVSYDAIEKIKDGFYMCAKYESKPIIRNCPHIFVFANFAPEVTAMSIDRWRIRKIG